MHLPLIWIAVTEPFHPVTLLATRAAKLARGGARRGGAGYRLW